MIKEWTTGLMVMKYFGSVEKQNENRHNLYFYQMGNKLNGTIDLLKNEKYLHCDPNNTALFLNPKRPVKPLEQKNRVL